MQKKEALLQWKVKKYRLKIQIQKNTIVMNNIL
jgi:hypothetical protein